jgi:hypothetical protein
MAVDVASVDVTDVDLSFAPAKTIPPQSKTCTAIAGLKNLYRIAVKARMKLC